MTDLLTEFSLDTENPLKNYELGAWYESQGHTAPAHSYYLRAADRSEDDILSYKALIRASLCYKSQGSRFESEKTLLENALCLVPDRPEAYYFLSLLYEKKQDWQNCYIHSTLGLECYKKEIQDLNILEYSGKHLLLFQKAISSWYWGKGKETREIFQLLFNRYYYLMDDNRKQIIDENMKNFDLDTSKKTIVDCFRFFNEKELLELRYLMLKDYVDFFVILEGTKTQSGIEREELLAAKYIEELNLPKEKFIIIEVDLPGNDVDIINSDDDILFRSLSGPSSDTHKNSLNARTRERLLLNSLSHVLNDFNDNTVFLVSDCDEIIDPKYIPYFSDVVLNNQNVLVKIPLVELQVSANLRAYNSETHRAVSTDHVFFMCTKSHFKNATPFQMRFNINNPYDTVYVTQEGKRIEDCGWHFSWMGDRERLKLKQKSTSHYADQIESSVIVDMSSKEIETYIDNWSPDKGTSIWGDNRIYFKEYPIEKLPEEIFRYDRLRNFFLSSHKKYSIANDILNILNKYDINRSETTGQFDGTDKFKAHSYLKIYTSIFSEYIDRDKGSLLEIGCYHGGSLLLWSELLKSWNIVGLDVVNAITPRIRSVFLDNKNVDMVVQNAYTTQCVDTLKNTHPSKFDIIIDDGPHTEESQLECLKLYFSLLNDGGTLIIEDIKSLSTVEKLNKILKEISDVDHEVSVFDHRYMNNQSDDIVFCVKKSVSKSQKDSSDQPIPVLGVPIVNGVHWLKRLINSIDYPVKDLFIINNNGRGQITEELNQLANTNYNLIENIKVVHMPSNLGVSASWNLIIKSYKECPYWIISNNDFAFTPGFLKEMVNKASNAEVGLVWPPSINQSYTNNGLGSFEAFLIKDWVVQECGLFDENLYPAYCEDCDYLVKIKRNNIKSEFITSKFLHGEGDSYLTGSQTLKQEPEEISKKVHNFHMLNRGYMELVWGHDWEDWNSHSGKGVLDKNKVFKEYDLNFIRKKNLGF